MKIKRLISIFLTVLFLFSSVNVSHAEIFNVSHYISMVDEQAFPALDYEEDMLNLNAPPLYMKQLLWIKEVMFPKAAYDMDIRRYVRGRSNTAKFLLVYKKVRPMCIDYLRTREGDQITNVFVKLALSMYSSVGEKSKWGDKWGLVAILWSVYHKIPCMCHEMEFVARNSSDCRELLFNLENLCLAYYQLAYNREYYRGETFDYMKDIVELNNLLL